MRISVRVDVTFGQKVSHLAEILVEYGFVLLALAVSL